MVSSIGETIARVDMEAYLAHYEEARGSSRRTRSSTFGESHGAELP